MTRTRPPSKCPFCDYISSRHWNVKSHTLKKHGVLGEPVRVLGRRKQAYQEQDYNVSHDSLKSQDLRHTQTNIPQNQFFDMNNLEEIQLSKNFKEIAPQFLQFEKLLRSEHIVEKYIQEQLASSVVAAVISPNPVEEMSNFIDLYTNMSTVRRMLSYICTSWNRSLYNVIFSLKKLRDSQVNRTPDG